jgi:hypothetical protein
MSEPTELSLEEFAPDWFLEELNRLNRLYEAMGAVLGVEEQLLQEGRQASKVKDPVGYGEWEHLIFDQQAEDIEECERLRAQFVLIHIEIAVRKLFAEAGFELRREARNLPVPADRKARHIKKNRGDWLKKVRLQFAREFNIDLASGPEWAVVEQVVMARHAVIHPESAKDHTKKSQPNARGVNGDEFTLTPHGVISTLERLGTFRAWLQEQVKARRGERGSTRGHP